MVESSNIPPEILEIANRLHSLLFLCMLLDHAFYRVVLQESRIKDGILHKDYQSVYADIHFFLIAVENIRKLVSKLHNELKEDSEYQLIYNRYNHKLTDLKCFREHLEHIDDNRIKGKDRYGKALKQPETLGSLNGNEYNFGGEVFNLEKSFKFLGDLLIDLKKWNKKVHYYPSWS